MANTIAGLSSEPSTANQPSATSYRQCQTTARLNPSLNVQEPIAIIGVSGCYPQAESLAEFWQNLKTGKDCISEIPGDRWPMHDFFHPDPKEAVAHSKSYSKWGGFVDGFAEFDPLFFNISPHEAWGMDPQERLLLQAAWHVLEDAGYTRESLQRDYQQQVGVFIGITKTGFELYAPEYQQQDRNVTPRTSFSSAAKSPVLFLEPARAKYAD